MKHEIDLSFCIWEYEDISHEDITAQVGIQPYGVYVKGQRKRPTVSALSKINGWIFKPLIDKYSSYEEQNLHASFEEQMDAILDILESKIDVFKPLCDKYYCEFSCALYIYTDTEESTPWVHLNSRYNKLLKELNIEFDVDIMLLSNSED